MSVTAARREEINGLEMKINDAITWMQTKQVELQAMVDLVSNVPEHIRDGMSRSASSSTKKKGRGETVDIDETLAKYQRAITEMRNAIAYKQQEVERLKKEKRELEEYEQSI
ncbi:hypothetical protein CEP51_005222 [Fusarium floridanum]|uniref:Uncharacterized protein n=1 Tax=Fusarium floridanum TaxID=1325733 RepID=A0A428RXS4_9HYPO|nr:hypothetical protein CEP51_005222 [Fusarium floridanum]